MTTVVIMGLAMKIECKNLAVVLVLVVILAGCESAFELPPGCAEEEPVTPTTAPVVEEQQSETKETEMQEEKPVSTDALPTKTVIEGDLVFFPHLKATDPDGDKISYTFTEPLDNSGRWRTKVGDEGEYIVTITASDGKTKAAQKVKIIVVSKNKPPVIEPIGDIEVNEGETVRLKPVITDPENDPVEVAFSGWMSTDSKETSLNDAGKYTVTIKAYDGKSYATQKVNVVVHNVNRPPVLEPINNVVIKEGDKITVKPVASDEDKDRLSFSFSEPLDANGVWQTNIGDAGTYDLKATVSDGEATAEAAFKVTVEGVNQPPVLKLERAEINVDEGDVVTIKTEASDPENDAVQVSYSGWMTSDTYTTTFEDQGVHTVTVTATDGQNVVAKDVVVTVRNVNRAPVFNAESFE